MTNKKQIETNLACYRTAIAKIKEIAEFSYRPYSACGEYNESCIVLTNILNVIEELKEGK